MNEYRFGATTSREKAELASRDAGFPRMTEHMRKGLA